MMTAQVLRTPMNTLKGIFASRDRVTACFAGGISSVALVPNGGNIFVARFLQFLLKYIYLLKVLFLFIAQV